MMDRCRLLCALVCWVAIGVPASAQEKGDAGRGEVFARNDCADCHAVLANQLVSPVVQAPPFVEIANAPQMSEVALFPFFQTSHVSMPNFVVAPDNIRDLTAYMLTLRH